MCLEKDSFVGGHNSSFIAYKVIFFSQAFALAKEGNHQEKCTKAFHVHIIDLKSFLEGTHYVYGGSGGTITAGSSTSIKSKRESTFM